jgi:hypothetical protein
VTSVRFHLRHFPPSFLTYPISSRKIEDAPALHALHAFAAEVKGGKILVTASVDQVKKGAPKRKQPKADAAKGVTGAGVVIVGGGAGCLSCVEALRQVGRLSFPSDYN